jgi:hypothetical protein
VSPVSLGFILGGIYAAGWLVYGRLTGPYLPGSLPLPAAFYGVLMWPFVLGLTEQMTYNGYLVPRFRLLCRNSVDRRNPAEPLLNACDSLAPGTQLRYQL